jgi:MobA/MobL family
MAIYSLNHSSVGRSTQKRAGTAGAHARYVLRPEAAREVIGEHMPTDRAGAKAWLDQQESASRKNERVIDKVRLALPLELNREERAALVRDFAQTLTHGRASWVAGIHDQGKDEQNPHAHLIIRDRDDLAQKDAFDRIIQKPDVVQGRCDPHWSRPHVP